MDVREHMLHGAASLMYEGFDVSIFAGTLDAASACARLLHELIPGSTLLAADRIVRMHGCGTARASTPDKQRCWLGLPFVDHTVDMDRHGWLVQHARSRWLSKLGGRSA